MPGPCARGRRQIPWLRQMETRSDRRFASSPRSNRHRMRATTSQPNWTRPRQRTRSAPASTKACSPSPKPNGCGTSNICGSLRNSPASSAAASPVTRTICGLRNPRGLSLKVSDEFTVPLCRAHHRELHRTGKESDWWAKAGLEPISLARKLWRETHPLHASADVLGDDGEKPGAANDEVTTMSRQPREPRMAKRTQLPGTPT